MGVDCKHSIMAKSQPEFHLIDEMVMGFSFDVQNEIGRLCDERIYQDILATKCRGASLPVEREVEILLSHKGFKKKYKMDLVVDDGVVYELKAVQSLTDSHKCQLINYLILTGIKHGKLINFGSSSVEYEFVSTRITPADRYDYRVNTNHWRALTEKCEVLRGMFCDLLSDWGVFLECGLYNEALIHFLGGSESILRPVKICYADQCVGGQKIQLLDDSTAFHLSAITKTTVAYEHNLKRLLKHTKLHSLQWINMNHQNISFKTITKNDFA